jgi:hypothetical protein
MARRFDFSIGELGVRSLDVSCWNCHR